MTNEKPEIGLKPRHIHDWERLVEIAEAVARFAVSNKAIPDAWLDEIKYLGRKNRKEDV